MIEYQRDGTVILTREDKPEVTTTLPAGQEPAELDAQIVEFFKDQPLTDPDTSPPQQ